MKKTDEESAGLQAGQGQASGQAGVVGSGDGSAVGSGLAATLTAAQAPAVAQTTSPTRLPRGQKYEPVTVTVKEKNIENCKLLYNVRDVISASSATWELVEQSDGCFVAVFEAHVHGTGYYKESQPIPKVVKDCVSVLYKGPKQDHYKVKLRNTGNKHIASYFEPKRIK